jgi:hypothetical protein
MFVVAANFASYWDLPTFWQTSAFYIFGPLVILAINWLGVKVSIGISQMSQLTCCQYYGYVEGVLGIVKLIFVSAGAIFLFVTGASSKSIMLQQGKAHIRQMAHDVGLATMLHDPVRQQQTDNSSGKISTRATAQIRM